MEFPKLSYLFIQDQCLFNYKKTLSIVLMSVCDSKYRFTLMDIDDSGSRSDGSFFVNRFLGYANENDILNIPTLSPRPDSETCLAFLFEGDEPKEREI